VAISFLCGFETGDASEIGTLGALSSIQSAVVRTGGYALKQAGAFSQINKVALSANQIAYRGYLQVPVMPGAATNLIQINSATNKRITVGFTAANVLQAVENDAAYGLTTIAGTATFIAGQQYRIEIALDQAAGGILRVWVDGVLDIDTTHTLDVTATPVTRISVIGRASPNEYFYDDFRIDTGTLTPPGPGRIIARQGIAGTPTYDAFTKNGGATSVLCWSDTPFSAATNCTGAVLGAKQTMLIAPFSLPQAGHGVEMVGAGDTINACWVGLIANTVSGDATGMILRRVNGTDGSNTFTQTAADVYYAGTPFTTTPANLDLLEAGIIHGNNTRATTVEDVWVMVEAQALTGTIPVIPPSDPTPFTGGVSGMGRAPRRYIQSSPKPSGPSPAERQKALTAALRKAEKPKTAPIVVGLQSTPEITYFTDAPPVADIFMPAPEPRPSMALVTDKPLVLPPPEPVKPPAPADEDDEEVMALMGL
jgi:hypothetical protein